MSRGLDKTPVYVVLETCQKGPLLRLAHRVCFLTYEAAEELMELFDCDEEGDDIED